MTQDEFYVFARAACTRAVKTPGRIGYLRLPQFYRREQREHKLREPEMCQALIEEANDHRLFHAVEAPTVEPYRFTQAEGEGKRRALHDFVLYGEGETDTEPRVRLELKEGAPYKRKDEAGEVVDIPALSKDIRKLILERSRDGRAMLHIVQAAEADGRTLQSLLDKYGLALKVAIAEIGWNEEAANADIAKTWFSLLILAVRWRGPIGQDRPAMWHIRLNTPNSQRALAREADHPEPDLLCVANTPRGNREREEP